MASTAPVGDIAVQQIGLLRAAHLILHAPDQATLIKHTARAAHDVLGFERVRFYIANLEEELIHKQFALGVEPDAQEPARRLSSTNFLGRAAIGGHGLRVWRIAALDDENETADGLPTCVVPVPLQEENIGILVADNPLTEAAVSPTTAQALELLTEFTTCSDVHRSRGNMGVEFVSKVSHELRTPLTSIRAFTEMLLDGDAGPLTDKQQRYVARVDGGAGMLLRVVEDLLELTHLELNDLSLLEEVIAPGPFLEDIAYNLAPQAKAKSITIRVEAEPGLPTLTTDQQRLQQAVSNLVDNAIKYSPEGTLVRLVASKCDEGLRLAVVDEGPGIHPDDQEKVFKTFYRAYQGAASLANKGSGLGLSIVRSLTRILGARLQLESEPGQGCTFALIFPLE